DIEHVDARVGEAPHQCRREARARETDVASDGHPARADELRIGAADAVRDILVELARDAAADVVGLEAIDFLHSPFALDRVGWSRQYTARAAGDPGGAPAIARFGDRQRRPSLRR